MINHYLKVAFRNLVKYKDTKPCQHHRTGSWLHLFRAIRFMDTL